MIVPSVRMNTSTLKRIGAAGLVCALLAGGCSDDSSAPGRDAETSQVVMPDAGPQDAGGGVEAGSFTTQDASLGQELDASTDTGVVTSLDAGAEAPPTDAGDPTRDAAPDAATSLDATASDSQLETALVDKLKMCGLHDPGANPSEYKVQDEFARCVARCVLPVPCPRLKAYKCGDPAEIELEDCFDRCSQEPPDGFACNDGMRIPHLDRCDEFEDCERGEDEQNCGPGPRCKDGTPLEAWDLRCDRVPDCRDGSDERDCPLLCADAEELARH